MRHTVLGDTLKDISYIPSQNQILRCPNQKKIESQYLLQMPFNSSFLDIGANFGDTTFTMQKHEIETI